MPIQEQGPKELKHISLLRKALTGRHSLIMVFNGPDWGSRLSLGDGMFDSSDEAISCLKQIFSSPVLSFSWEPLSKNPAMPLDPKVAFFRALMGIDLEDDRLAVYKSAFSKLPPVHVKAGTLFRLNAEDMKQYQILYSLGLDEKGVQISGYLNVDDRSLLMRRIRIILTCYCLGQFITADNLKASGSKVSMAAKILARLRGK